MVLRPAGNPRDSPPACHALVTVPACSCRAFTFWEDYPPRRLTHSRLRKGSSSSTPVSMTMPGPSRRDDEARARLETGARDPDHACARRSYRGGRVTADGDRSQGLRWEGRHRGPAGRAAARGVFQHVLHARPGSPPDDRGCRAQGGETITLGDIRIQAVAAPATRPGACAT